jgi:hypothetical protein
VLPHHPRERSRVIVLAAVALLTSVRTYAQLPAEPIVFGDGRVTLGGDVSVTYGCATGAAVEGCGEDVGFFNYTSYDDSLIRNFRIDLSASVKAGEHVSFLTEIRTENLRTPEPYALYARIRPWRDRRFDIQIGRIPPSFGAFSRRPYPSDNILIGYPLAYQYLTSLRPDSLPANADELVRMRGRGWLSNFSVGNTTPQSGLPLVNGLIWDTGVQVHGATDLVDASVSVTTGTLTKPLVRENNGGKQLSGRVALQPVQGFILGGSYAHGPFAAREAAESAGLSANDRSITESAWGADVEYSRGHYLVRAETVITAWRVPIVRTPVIHLPLRAVGTSVEGRYRILPGLYGAARWDHLGFNDVQATAGRRDWDAAVTRIEAGVGYSLRRNILLKVAYQHNDRDGGRVPTLGIGAAQLVYWF